MNMLEKLEAIRQHRKEVRSIKIKALREIASIDPNVSFDVTKSGLVQMDGITIYRFESKLDAMHAMREAGYNQFGPNDWRRIEDKDAHKHN